jgi:hypothetical protein
VHEAYEGHHDPCTGDEETFAASLDVWETWTLAPPFPQELPLGRTDPTIPVTSEGQILDQQEETGIGGGLIVITNAWTWKLTLEPDATQ